MNLKKTNCRSTFYSDTAKLFVIHECHHPISRSNVSGKPNWLYLDMILWRVIFIVMVDINMQYDIQRVLNCKGKHNCKKISEWRWQLMKP